MTGVRPHRDRSSKSKLSVPSPDRSPQPARVPISSVPGGSQGQLPSEVQLESQEEMLSFSETLRVIPSWLISMVVHIAILLILAFCTLSLDEISDGQIVVEISDSPVEMISTMTEISMDESELIDSAQLFEDFEPEPIEFEEVMLEPEFSDESQLLTIPEELPPINLPEFMTAAEKLALRESEKGKLDGQLDSVQRPDKGSADGENPKQAEFFGTKAYGSKFVFVIDGSSSMRQSRWPRATRELVSTINELDQDQDFLVLLYNTSTTVMFNLSEDRADLIPATDENKQRILGWLGRQRPRGGTTPAQTMRLALSRKPDAIYFLSDGELADDTLFRLKNWNAPKLNPKGELRQIPIHTVLLGSPFGFMTMKMIADQNNGIFTSVR
jgi:hypothetical protein